MLSSSLKRSEKFVSDEQLAYVESRRHLKPGDTLTFDDTYREAHLPLINRLHPKAILSRPGSEYRNGCYEATRYSFVAMVEPEDLYEADQFRQLKREMMNSPFSPKVDWPLLDRRRGMLHVTIASGLRATDVRLGLSGFPRDLAKAELWTCRLGGPFLGNKNTGRLYLPAYPPRVDGVDGFAELQRALNRPCSRFYALGLFNFLDELTEDETTSLRTLLDAWSGTTILEYRIPRFAFLATNDDLVLSGHLSSELRRPI